MPVALDADIRAITTHPSVRRVSSEEDSQGAAIVEVDLDIGLGSRYLERGHGENGVQPIETVTLVFPTSYPSKGPYLKLRQDFERNLPHMLSRSPESAPAPCVIDGEAADFVAQRGMRAFVDQVVDWLYKAAHNALMDPDQGWEPIRRDCPEHTFIADPDYLRGLARKEGAGTTLKAATIALDEKCNVVRGVVLDELQVFKAPLVSPQVSYHLPSLAIVVHPPANGPDGKRLENASYAADSVSSIADVYTAARRFGCFDRLVAQMNLLGLRLGQKKQSIAVWIILFARRPMRIRDQESDLEMIGYFAICEKPKDVEAKSNVKVYPARHHNAVTKSLLQRMSDRDAEDRPTWGLIGAGSLGSKIALHLGRQGDGPDLVVDMHTMLPHNYARHSLLPEPLGPSGSGLDKVDWAAFVSKAELLSFGLEKLGQKCAPLCLDVALASHENLNLILDQRRRLLLDTTASHHVPERLCANELADKRPRLAAASLLGAGSVARLMLEGPKSNPNGVEIEAWSLGHLEKDRELAQLAARTGGRAVPIGQGCVSLTAVMSDAKLSVMAATLSECMSGYLDEGLPDDGEVVLGTLQNDGLSRSFKRYRVGAFRRLKNLDGHVLASVAGDIDPPCGSPVEARGRRVRINGHIVVTDGSDGSLSERYLESVGWILGSEEDAKVASSVADEMARREGRSILLWPFNGLWRGEIRIATADDAIEVIPVDELTS